MIFLMTIYFIIKKKIYKRPFELICILAAYWCIPPLTYIIRFVSMQVNYHTLMVMCLSLIYIMAVVYAEHLSKTGKLEKVLRTIAVIVLSGMVYCNLLTANYAYYNMNLSYEKTYAVTLDVLRRIEENEEFDSDKKIAVIGTYDAVTPEMMKLTPEIAGVSNDTFLMRQDHYFAMWKYCMGRDYTGVSTEEAQQIQKTDAYKEMRAYPYAGCVKIIDGTVVVKMSEDK